MKFFNIKNYLICLLITTLLVILRMMDPFFVETLRLKGIDYYQTKQEKVKSENIAIVEIDEASLDQNVIRKNIEKGTFDVFHDRYIEKL